MSQIAKQAALVLAALVAGLGIAIAAPPTEIEANGIRLRSVAVDLPASIDRPLPPGPNAELVATNCQTCHSAGMILNQPSLTRAEWTGEVNKMIRVYKAPVAESDTAAIIDYLASLKVSS